MEKIHNAEGDVLMQVSPLIDFRSRNSIQSSLKTVTAPLHAQNKEGKHKDKQVELSPIHDFSAKLRQPSIINVLKDYVHWQAQWREAYSAGQSIDEILEQAPNHAPLSVNLDVTTACNYRCDHCVDMDILNTGIRYDHEKLKSSLTTLIDKGLRSVIIIGGGEPTVYPGFADIVRHLKARDIKIGVVTNGSRMDRIAEVADVLTQGGCSASGRMSIVRLTYVGRASRSIVWNNGGAGMLHLRELQVLCCVCVVERDREVVGKLAYY